MIRVQVVRRSRHLRVLVQQERHRQTWFRWLKSDEWVSGPVAAAILGVSAMTITNRRRAGSLVARRRGYRYLYRVGELLAARGRP